MRILHTMLRVGDLERSIAFYTEVLGMRLMRRKDYPDGEFTLAFLGYQEESEATALELTHNWGVTHYEMGNAYGHLALEVDDVYAAVDAIRAARSARLFVRRADECRQHHHRLRRGPGWLPYRITGAQSWRLMVRS